MNADLVRLWMEFDRRASRDRERERRYRQDRQVAAANQMNGSAAAYDAARLAVQRALDATPAAIRTEFHLLERGTA